MTAAKERRLSPSEYKFVEHKLYFYRDNKRLIEEYLARSDELIHSTKRREFGMPGGKRPIHQSHVEATAIQLVILEEKARREKFWVEAIEDVLELLPDEDRKLVELKYFQQLSTNSAVAMQLNMSDSSFYRRKDEVVWRFTNRFGLV